VALGHNGVPLEFSAEKIEASIKEHKQDKRRIPISSGKAPQAGVPATSFISTERKCVTSAATAANTFSIFLAQDKKRYKNEEGIMKKIARSAMKSVDIQASPEKAFAFLANPMNWPQYAVVNLRSVSRGQDGWFHAVTKFGEGALKVRAVKELGVFDHVWKDPQATWQVYSRVVPNGDGATVMMSLFQPAVMSDQQFDEAMNQMDTEMKKLKEILEQ
jgi:hypothetical protein